MIDDSYFLLVTVLLCLGTFLIRVSFIAFSGVLKVSPEVRELFTYIPAAIFPALFVPATFFYQGTVAWLGGMERFWVLVAASVVCFFYRSTLVVISFGLLLLYVVTVLLRS